MQTVIEYAAGAHPSPDSVSEPGVAEAYDHGYWQAPDDEYYNEDDDEAGEPMAGLHDDTDANAEIRIKEEEGPAVVPSQWKVGAVLDKLRFPEYGGDWDTLMAAVSGSPYTVCMPRSSSPLSEEDMAREYPACSPLSPR